MSSQQFYIKRSADFHSSRGPLKNSSLYRALIQIVLIVQTVRIYSSRMPNIFDVSKWGFPFGQRYDYRFMEWINYYYFSMRHTKMLRLRYAYYYILLTFVCVHRMYLFFLERLDFDDQIFHYDYGRIVFRVPTRYIIWVSVDASMYDSFRRYVFLIPLEFFTTFQRVFVGRQEYPAPFPIQYFPHERYKATCLRLYHWVTYSFSLIWITEMCSVPFTLHKVVPVILDKSPMDMLYYTTGFIWNAYAYHHVGAMMSLVSTSAASFALLYLFLFGRTYKNIIAHLVKIRDGRKLLRWRRNYIKLLIFLFKINHIQGPSLTSVILCGTPPHAYLTMYIISHPNMSLFELINNLVALSVVSTYIFFCHGYLSAFCDTVSAAAKVLYGHMAANRVRPTVRQRLILGNLILAIHSKRNPYGYTYGSHGLICHKSFIEFVWLYIGFMLYAYKMIFH